MGSVRVRRVVAAASAVLVLVSMVPVAGVAEHTPAPIGVAVVGSLQSELGCPGDWQPDCAATELTQDASDGVWQETFTVPAGSWEYKAALNDSWDENYGANAQLNGGNIPLNLAAESAVKFYYSHDTHWITDAFNSRIVTAAGSFQSELGCPGDWQPDCLRSWLQDPDGDGLFEFSTGIIPAGDYEAKATIGESWDENYGAGGVANGPNIPFTVGDGQTVTFSFVSTTNDLTIEVSGGSDIEPGDELLVRQPARPESDEIVYFTLTDRFSNGDPSNDTGGSASTDPLDHGFLPTDKGYYHGGDLAGLSARLDYLDSLGVTAIWITPPFVNRWVQGDGTIAGSSAAYHGYWQTDFTQIDPHLGSNAEMQALIADAHSRGMKVMFDVVVNHTADVITYEEGVFTYRNKADFPYRDASGAEFDDRDFANDPAFPALDPDVSFPYTPTFEDPADVVAKAPAWLNDPIYYHNRGDSTFSGESSLYGDFFGLDDLFTEHPDVVDGMVDIAKSFIDTFDVDGFRIDTVKHVNDELWAEWVPEILAHAEAAGKPDFVMFGEVFGETVQFRSRYSTSLDFPGTLDFSFDGAVTDFAAGSSATDGLRELFALDDWYTDSDSNAHSLATFLGNHDVGRFGLDVVNSNAGASDAELVDRVMLGQALNLLTRGRPVIYYGDEQGFVGDGGDKDARQDMFPSQVPSYNDDDLIGTSSTTGDDNFDPTHVLYQEIAALTALRSGHPGLQTGAQIHRYSESTAGIYAFSRIDRAERVEYLVVVNNSESADSASFDTDTVNSGWTLLAGDGSTVASDGNGGVTVDVPALAYAVYRADSPVTVGAGPSIAMLLPPGGSDVSGRVEVAADIGGGHAEVTFAVSVGGAAYTPIGVDDNAPHRVFYDVSGLGEGTEVSFKAIASDLDGNLASAKVTATVAAVEPPPPAGGAPRYAIVHYLRDGGDYGDHTTGDFNDFWGLHLWGEAIAPHEVTEWTSPKPFLGEDDYGRFAWIELADASKPVNFIVHRGDSKDGTDQDRQFDPAVNPEIWLRDGDPNEYTNQAEAQGFVTIHYHRDDGDYGDPTSSDFNDFWGLHLWGDAIEGSEGTEWTAPKKPTGFDDFGPFWEISIVDATQPVNYIIHRGDTKDPGPDQSFVPAEQAAVWQNSGDPTQHESGAAATNTATIHYHRPDGDYGDPTSPDFSDFWGLHVWEGAASPNPSWQEPVRPARFDTFGPVFEVPLLDGASQLAYIIHRGDTKDPGPDQFLDLDLYGYEVWQLQGADPDAPYILPIPSGGPISRDNLDEQQAYWVDADTIVWTAAEAAGADFALCWSAAAALAVSDSGLTGEDGCTELLPAGAYLDPPDGFRHLEGLPVLSVPQTAPVHEILDAQHAVVASQGDVRLDATGLQIPGVLDDLYATDVDLGVTWDGDVPTISVWAPTATDVDLVLFEDSTTTVSTSLDMAESNGVWSVTGDVSWSGDFYLFEVDVYSPVTDQNEVNLVTDPYSVSLAMNSTRSQIVDLSDDELLPSGWADVPKPPLTDPEDITIYELHIRDFSVNDPSVPDEYEGTYKAFTLDGTHGMNHLKALAESGLSHLHLLPAFDIATIDEDRSTWESPDFETLRSFPPDSEEQQALVSQTADVDGFNWGYDPWHYTTPEGSYSTDPDGSTRIVEFREMVQAINETGLRVVMDVVYNHTNASGQAEKSVLDRIVPGYYHRLDANGQVEKSTCCENTATEHAMMEKLMIDSVVTWATEYKVDAFRFDLMGHHTKQNMVALRAALDALTISEHGVDGSKIYLYGEGWNFGEVANDARFVQATQANMAGTGIGTFSDRLRDAVRGGSPFDGGIDLIRQQGVINGLWYDPNAEALPTGDAFAELMLSLDQIRVGLAGNLAAYSFVDRNGNVVTGADIDYGGSPAGYTADPQEHIVYVSKHDNQTLFDISQYRHPLGTGMDERVRAQNLGIDFTLFAQGVPFVHAGVDTLRSKSLDRDSFNSGDWFNRLDWTYGENGWGSGLPVASKNADNWDIMRPLLGGLEQPTPDHIASAAEHLREALAIRESSPLFRLETAADVQDRLGFHNTGADQIPALVVMSLDDRDGDDIDPIFERIVVLFNAGDEPIEFSLADTVGEEYELHPVQQASDDPLIGSAAFDQASGTFSVPARTTAVFVTDITPPQVTAELEPVRGKERVGWFTVVATCTDADPEITLTIDINGHPVEVGDVVRLVTHPIRTDAERKEDRIDIFGSEFVMTVTCSDSSGNTTTVLVQPPEPSSSPE